jgi:predicted transport protein
MTDPAWESMAANLASKSGRTLDEWVTIVREQGIEKHGQIISYLKSEHGMTHGYANFVATVALRPPAEDTDLVAEQYAGAKAALRPIYETLLSTITRFGPDVEVAPKKTYVSLRRSRQFALVKPSSRSRLEIGLNLPGEPATPRLRASGGMCSHIVDVTSADDLDAELEGWLRQAYSRA